MKSRKRNNSKGFSPKVSTPIVTEDTDSNQLREELQQALTLAIPEMKRRIAHWKRLGVKPEEPIGTLFRYDPQTDSEVLWVLQQTQLKDIKSGMLSYCYCEMLSPEQIRETIKRCQEVSQ